MKKIKIKINGKTLTLEYIRNQLDYSLETYEERLELVNKIFSKDNDDFFVEYFDNYYNPHLGATTEISEGKPLAENEPVCHFLDTVAKYLDNNSKEEYKLKNQINDKEVNINGISDNTMMRNDGETQSLRNVNTFSEKDIESFGGNFKKIIKQKIFKSDFKRLPILVEYQKVIKYIQEKIKGKLSYGKIKKYIYIMYSMKDDQIWLKDALCGTIYFKNVLPDNGLTNYTCFDLDLFCVDDCKILLKLISFDNVHFMNNYVNIYKKLKKNIKFTDKEMKMIDVLEKGKIDRYRILEEEPEGKNKKRKTIYNGAIYSISELARELKIHKLEAKRLFDNIALKISNAYVEWYEDNVYYLEKVKGKYKKCSRCGEIKLLNRFGDHSGTIDGKQSVCKKCDAERK